MENAYLFIIIIIFGNTGVWTQGLVVTRRVLYNLSHTTSPFSLVLVIFQIRSHFLFLFVWWDWSLKGFMLVKQAFYHLSHTSSPFCSGYFVDEGLKNCLPRLASLS
jgi:hypothetical protein